MRIKALVVASVLLVVALPLFAPIYMKMEGITGESKAPGHEGWIELESLSFAPMQLNAAGGGGGAGKSVHEFTITKKLDSSSPVLAKAAMSGQRFQNVTLDMNGQRTLLQGVLIGLSQQMPSPNGGGTLQQLKMSYQHDLTHESPAGGNVANKKFLKIEGNATLNGGTQFGPPGAVGLRSLHLNGNNRAIIVVCDVAGAQSFTGPITRAVQSKQVIPNLTFSVSSGGDHKATSPAYKELPAVQFSFTNATIQGNQPMGDGCNQMSLNFTRFSGPTAGFDYIK